MKNKKIETLIEEEQVLSKKIRHLKFRINLQRINPNSTWKKDLKNLEKELRNIQEKMLNYFKEE